jgi:hypothetical protein
MKPVGLIGTGVLLLLLGTVAPTYAQQEQHDQDARPQEQQAKPEKQQQAKGQQGQQHKQQQAKGQHEQQQKHQQQAEGQHEQQQKQQQQEHQQQANRPSQQQQHGHESEQRVVWQEHRAHHWQSEHRSWQQRGGYNGYRIPEDRYRGHFGPGHAFRMYRYPVMVVGGYPRFQYSGFWFSILDPWPEYWSNNWYDDDDVYIDYAGDGYYLYNRRYPRDRIAITISVN